MAEVRPQVTLSQYLHDRRGQTEEQRVAAQSAVDYQSLQDAYNARAERNATIQPPLGQGVGLNAQVGNPGRPALADFINSQGTGNRAVNPQRTNRIGYNEELHGAVVRPPTGAPTYPALRPNPQANPALKTAVGTAATVTSRSNQQIANDRAKRLRERRANAYQRPDASLSRRGSRIV